MPLPASPETLQLSDDGSDDVVIRSSEPNTVIFKRVIETIPESSCNPVVLLENGSKREKDLKLLFLGCEAKPPYGPYDHTASLFMDLIAMAISKFEQQKESSQRNTAYNVSLHVYYVSQGNFPTKEALEDCNGVILPGSFNSAYDNEAWIVALKNVIQTELVDNGIPTLGVCFGHQIYAHSFPEGSVIKCPAGSQAGKRTVQLTNQGKEFLRNTNMLGRLEQFSTATSTSLDLFYTHGDMVEKLPPHASSLGGNDNAPIQAAIYYSQKEESTKESPKVVAVTFQAHPEYATSLDMGIERTLLSIIEAMKERGDITEEDGERAKKDALQEYKNVQEQSVDAIICACHQMGWLS